MALHPDDRPQTVDVFRESLLGSFQPVTRPASKPGSSITHYLYTNPERILIWFSAGLAVLSLIATLAR